MHDLELFCYITSIQKVHDEKAAIKYPIITKKGRGWGVYSSAQEIAQSLVNNLSFNPPDLGYNSIKIYLSLPALSSSEGCPYIQIDKTQAEIFSPFEITLLQEIQENAIKLLQEKNDI
ncbi:MAG: hypothetical protein ABIH72_05295 [archaeon]